MFKHDRIHANHRLEKEHLLFLRQLQKLGHSHDITKHQPLRSRKAFGSGRVERQEPTEVQILDVVQFRFRIENLWPGSFLLPQNVVVVDVSSGL